MTRDFAMNRRTFICSAGVGAVVGAVCANSVAAATRPRGMAAALYVFDETSDAATRFSATLAQAQRQALPIGFDPARIWHKHLAPAMARGQAIVGVTRGDALFCFAELTRGRFFHAPVTFTLSGPDDASFGRSASERVLDGLWPQIAGISDRPTNADEAFLWVMSSRKGDA